MKEKVFIYFRTLILFAMFFSLITIYNSCDFLKNFWGKADDLTEKVTTALDYAIGTLNANSANYKEVLQKLVTDLPKEVQSTVTNEVSNLMQRTVAAAGAEIRCDADFFRMRVQQDLLRIKARFLNQSLPDLEPQLCNVVPLAIDMNLSAERRNKLEFYGYDFDSAAIQVILVNGSSRIDVSNKLNKPTHYHMTLNLGSNGVPVSNNSTQIVLRWKDRDISSIPVVQAATPVCQTSFENFQPAPVSYMPPLVNGDREFDGHGPDVYANVRLINSGSAVIARVYLKAVETRSDWTQGEGTKDFVIYNSDPGKKIVSIVTPDYSAYSYRDDNHEVDDFPGSGPVLKYHFTGDTDGDDVGYKTRVDIDFNNIRVELKETGNCVSSATLKMIELQNAISPELLNKAKVMSDFKLISPDDLGKLKK